MAPPSLKQERRIALFLLSLTLGLTALSVSSRREYWPFCTYPMFRETVACREVSYYRLLGVEDSGATTLLDGEQDLGPRLPVRLQNLFSQIAQLPAPEQHQSMVFLRNLGRASNFRHLELQRFRWELQGESLDPRSPNEREVLVRLTP